MEKELLTNSLTLAIKHDDIEIENLILEDEVVLASMAGLYAYRSHIELLIKVINASVIKHMVTKATPMEVVALRHEMLGAEKILDRLEQYNEVYKRREKKEEEAPEAPNIESEEGKL